MAWDSTREVPWQRLMREWVIYAVIMTALFLMLFRDASTIGAIAGVLISGPLYLALGYVLAKFGYQRKTMKQLRGERAAPTEAGTARTKAGGTAGSPAARPRPAPTRRTAQGPNRPGNRKKR